MIALVFLQSVSQATKLVNLLCHLDVFDTIYHAENEQDCSALLQQNPNALSFLPVGFASLCPPSSCWVAVGETTSDALTAFHYSAQGFIHAPFDEKQLECVIQRLTLHCEKAHHRRQYQRLVKGLCIQYGVNEHALLATLRRQHALIKAPGIVSVKAQDGWCCLQPQDIKWIEACGDYMEIHTLDRRLLVRSTLCQLMQKLGHEYYIRCNRSVAVNLDFVDKIDKVGSQLHVILDDGQRFKMSRRYQTPQWHPTKAASMLAELQ